MEPDNYIVAIELGTSKIVGVIGHKNENGVLSVLAIDKEDSAGCIKRGCIQNVEEAAARVKKIIAKLENRIIPDKIDKVYVGIGGQSVRTIDHSVRRQLPEDTQVTETLINALHSESRSYPIFNSEIMDVVPNEYMVDNHIEAKPVGAFCSEIQANLKLIIGRPSIKKNIIRCLTERLKMPVAGYIISAKATASALLTSEERNLGCALIDFGGGTTTLSIYKDDFLRYMITIPFGGKNITRDICSLNVLEGDAEKLKIAFGSAINNPITEKGIKQLGIEGLDSSKIKYQDLCHVIEARIEEIVENVIDQIDASGYGDQLSAGIIITGGASQLRELPELLRQKTGMEVKRGTLPKNIQFVNRAEAGNPAYAQAIGLLLLGTENCVRKVEPETISETQKNVKKETATGHKQEAPKPQKPPKPSFIDKLKKRAEQLFDDNDAELK
ncbi:cell division protein FtsA [Coprobacter tertius]|uniref:Cell division protein FtsA n=1 Tax=Coprobacter tertius TaxID=2944915 RepID=A0ABT1MDN5_9BACT|nr:cell division protein FtsA [Coprobacter tertius]MCP9610742.1 cell division protein FtsA [Coprobacter tertius]